MVLCTLICSAAGAARLPWSTCRQHNPACTPLPSPSCRPRQLPAVLPAAPRPLRHFQCTAVAQPPVRMGGGGAAKRGSSSGPGRSGSDAGSSSSQQSSQTGVPAAQLHHERPRAPPEAAEEQQASSPAPPPPHQRADEAAQLLPIAFADGRVTVGDGTLLLDNVTPLARVQHPAGTDMVLLSMQAAKGASSMEDFPLGKVRPVLLQGWLAMPASSCPCWCTAAVSRWEAAQGSALCCKHAGV